MFSFLCLFGPGIICWLVCKYFSLEEKNSNLFNQICAILAYSIIVMAITSILLEPSGDVTIVTLANGMLTVHYGTKALALSVALAAGLGVINAIGIQKFMHYKSKFFVVGIAAAAALCILVYGTGAPIPDGTVHISTKPLRINNVYYNSDVPIYVNESEEYFIQVRTLAKCLDIDYQEKRKGLFQMEYTLGDKTFKLNLLKTDTEYFKKDGELFISFSNLANLEGINVKNSSTLSDGSSRQIIYIDNYTQRFNYDWTQYPYVAHAMGGIEDQTYTNSREAFIENYNAGHRVFEVDLRLTSDGKLVAVHDLPNNKNGKPMTQKEFKKYKILGKYTSLSFIDIAKLMKQYPDIYIITDTKEIEPELVAQQFKYIEKVGQQVDSEILKRIIPQIYNMEMFDTVIGIYNWNSMVYTLYALADFSESEVINFAYQRSIGVIATHIGKNQKLFFNELYERDIKIYMHTFNTAEEEAALKWEGVSGLYTDFLQP